MKKKGLTLVELLIVIGIIAVLVGLLFPVFKFVRERARINYCINSLKQVGLALHMYAQRFFDRKPLASIATLKDLPPFTGFPDLLEQVQRIDVLWFERKPRAFPKFAFEVETTPEFRRALLGLYQLRNFDTALYVVSNAAKRDLFEKRLLDEPFHDLRHRFVFRSFDDVLRIYQLQVQLAEEEEVFFANLIRRKLVSGFGCCATWSSIPNSFQHAFTPPILQMYCVFISWQGRSACGMQH